MSKAEERALEHFPNKDKDSLKAKFGFLLGYHQAKEDLELTWEDIKKLGELISTKRINDGLFDKEDYEEVLKRFKAQKEKL